MTKRPDYFSFMLPFCLILLCGLYIHNNTPAWSSQPCMSTWNNTVAYNNQQASVTSQLNFCHIKQYPIWLPDHSLLTNSTLFHHGDYIIHNQIIHPYFGGTTPEHTHQKHLNGIIHPNLGPVKTHVGCAIDLWLVLTEKLHVMDAILTFRLNVQMCQ